MNQPHILFVFPVQPNQVNDPRQWVHTIACGTPTVQCYYLVGVITYLSESDNEVAGHIISNSFQARKYFTNLYGFNEFLNLPLVPMPPYDNCGPVGKMVFNRWMFWVQRDPIESVDRLLLEPQKSCQRLSTEATCAEIMSAFAKQQYQIPKTAPIFQFVGLPIPTVVANLATLHSYGQVIDRVAKVSSLTAIECWRTTSIWHFFSSSTEGNLGEHQYVAKQAIGEPILTSSSFNFVGMTINDDNSRCCGQQSAIVSAGSAPTNRRVLAPSADSDPVANRRRRLFNEMPVNSSPRIQLVSDSEDDDDDDDDDDDNGEGNSDEDSDNGSYDHLRKEEEESEVIGKRCMKLKGNPFTEKDVTGSRGGNRDKHLTRPTESSSVQTPFSSYEHVEMSTTPPTSGQISEVEDFFNDLGDLLPSSLFDIELPMNSSSNIATRYSHLFSAWPEDEQQLQGAVGMARQHKELLQPHTVSPPSCEKEAISPPNNLHVRGGSSSDDSASASSLDNPVRQSARVKRPRSFYGFEDGQTASRQPAASRKRQRNHQRNSKSSGTKSAQTTTTTTTTTSTRKKVPSVPRSSKKH